MAYASKILLDKRIERAVKRAKRYSKWKHDPSRNRTAKELAAQYRRKVLKKAL